MRRTTCDTVCRLITYGLLALWIALLCSFVCCALLFTAQNHTANIPIGQQVDVTRDAPLVNALLTAALCAALAWLHRGISRTSARRILLLALWMLAALIWIFAVQMQPRADSERVVEAAKALAAGDDSPLRMPYFQGCAYQFSFVLVTEVLIRLCPWADINLLMQTLNVLLSAGILLSAADLAEQLSSDARARGACLLLLVVFLPTLWFCTFVYSLLPMLLTSLAAMACFLRYVRTGRQRFGAGFALCIAVSLFLKPNAIIPALALLICAALLSLRRRAWTPVLWAGLSILVGLSLTRGAQALYVWRTGIPLRGDVTLLARLTMGFQESPVCAGWFNGYIDQFLPVSVSIDAQKATAMADLRARFAEFAAQPGMLGRYLGEKYLIQWVEPTYDLFFTAQVSSCTGRYNGLAIQCFRDGYPLCVALRALLNIVQQALYALALLGAVRTVRHRVDEATLMLPLCVLGGFAYHMLFEAKSQYNYPYMVMLMPFAAWGLCWIQDGLRRAAARWRARATRHHAKEEQP